MDNKSSTNTFRSAFNCENAEKKNKIKLSFDFECSFPMYVSALDSCSSLDQNKVEMHSNEWAMRFVSSFPREYFFYVFSAHTKEGYAKQFLFFSALSFIFNLFHFVLYSRLLLIGVCFVFSIHLMLLQNEEHQPLFRVECFQIRSRKRLRSRHTHKCKTTFNKINIKKWRIFQHFFFSPFLHVGTFLLELQRTIGPMQ